MHCVCQCRYYVIGHAYHIPVWILRGLCIIYPAKAGGWLVLTIDNIEIADKSPNNHVSRAECKEIC
jgi:hypothetical protein